MQLDTIWDVGLDETSQPVTVPKKKFFFSCKPCHKTFHSAPHPSYVNINVYPYA